MEMLSTLVTEVGKSLFATLKRQINFLINYENNLEKLRNQARNLRGKRNDVQVSVDAAQRTLEEPTEEVQEWLRRADDIEADVRKLNEDASQNTRCLKGFCPDWSSRRRLSKQAVNKLHVVEELLEKGNFSTVSHAPPLSSVELVRTDCVENFASRELVFDQVMQALRDENIRCIGVHGMGGVGKTTLVNRLNNELEGTQLFQKVIMVTVSSNWDPKRIQGEIAERLGLTLVPDSSALVRSNKLFERLKKEETVLIILDDVWERLELTEIGIPTRTEHKGCKVILTTRILDVCREMGIRTVIEVKLLFEEESWNLFKTKAGDVTLHEKLQPIARDIARKCKGSPLAIVALGSSLRDENEEFEWRKVLRALESPEPMEIEGIMPQVITSLRYSYNHLNGQEIKLCFLFCCLFSEDYDISLHTLRNYGIGEGFLKVNGPLNESMDKLLSCVKKLKNSGLLLNSRKEGHVRMHDVVRDVAISIASKDENGFRVKAGVNLTNWTERENLNTYKRISFMRSVGIELPTPSECPQLLTLSLREVEDLKINPDNFFEGMKALAVLDLSHTEFTSIPQSIVDVTNLRTLDLSYCDLSTNLSLLGGLKNLEILDLSNSNIVKLPEEIGNLTNLKCLNLTYATISILTPNVISRLSKLEELYMDDSFNGWDTVTEEGEHNANFAEVALLPHLNTLKIDIEGEKCTSIDIPSSWENLKEFQVRAGTASVPRRVLKYSQKYSQKCLCLDGINLMKYSVKVLFKRTQLLSLSSCSGFNNVADLDTAMVFKHLEYLKIRNCGEMEYLISIGEESRQDSFGGLENLEISGMGCMKKIFHGIPPVGLFGQLKSLNVDDCPNLINIFSSDLLLPVQRLENLEYLNVRNCHMLEEVFNAEELVESEGNHTMPMLSRLRKIDLYNLKNLKSIWKGVLPTGSLRNLKTLQVNNCSVLKYLFPSSVSLQQLERIEVVRCPQLEILPLKPKGASDKSCPQPLFQVIGGAAWTFKQLKDIEVRSIHDVECLISIEEEESPQDSFGCLKKLRIKDMGIMKKIIHGLPPVGLFGQLKFLHVDDCPNLINIFSSDLLQNVKNLEELNVENCDMMQEVFNAEGFVESEGNHTMHMLSRLKKISLSNLKNLESIWKGVLPTGSLQNIETLEVTECSGFKYLFPSSVRLQQLVRLKISSCHEMEKTKQSECLLPLGSKGASNKSCLQVIRELGAAGTFKQLKYLEVGSFHDVECLISIGEEESPQDSFGGLETLRIKDMGNMKKIIHGLPPVGLFGQLKFLHVDDCPNLINIFSSDLLQNVKNLEELYVENCDMMQEVFNAEGFVESEGNHTMPMLSRLRKIDLYNLKNLKSIWKGVLPTGSFQQLEWLEISSCHEMEKIISNGEEEEVEEHVLGTEETTSSSRQRQMHTRRNFLNLESPKTFQNLEYLTIEGCQRSKNLFSFSLAQGFQQLETLEVSDCDEMGEIIANEDGQDEGVAQGLLPQLKHLKLSYLHDLTSICQWSFLLDSLKDIKVVGCPKLKRLPLGSKGSYKKLKEIKGEKEWFEGLEWDDENLKSRLQPLFKAIKEGELFYRQSLQEEEEEEEEEEEQQQQQQGGGGEPDFESTNKREDEGEGKGHRGEQDI